MLSLIFSNILNQSSFLYMLQCGELHPRDWLKSIFAYMSSRTGAPTKMVRQPVCAVQLCVLMHVRDVFKSLSPIRESREHCWHVLTADSALTYCFLLQVNALIIIIVIIIIHKQNSFHSSELKFSHLPEQERLLIYASSTLGAEISH